MLSRATRPCLAGGLDQISPEIPSNLNLSVVGTTNFPKPCCHCPCGMEMTQDQ